MTRLGRLCRRCRRRRVHRLHGRRRGRHVLLGKHAKVQADGRHRASGSGGSNVSLALGPERHKWVRPYRSAISGGDRSTWAPANGRGARLGRRACSSYASAARANSHIVLTVCSAATAPDCAAQKMTLVALRMCARLRSEPRSSSHGISATCKRGLLRPGGSAANTKGRGLCAPSAVIISSASRWTSPGAAPCDAKSAPRRHKLGDTA